MAIYAQTSSLPIIFQVGRGKVGEVGAILESKHLRFRSILLVSGASVSSEIAKRVTLDQIARHEIVYSNHISEVNRLADILGSRRFDLIIGVGGGKVLDIVKRVALLERINHLSIPTVIASDGLISPISVILNEQGATESIPGSMPMGVIVDIDIISQSPLQYIQAAAGDLLSNMSATNDWIVANARVGEDINDVALQLSRMAAHSVINFKNVDLRSPAFLKMLIQGQVNSGISMALAGTSRPCSGSEHLISHALDFMGASSDLHGLQVGSLSLFCLYLQRKLKLEHLDYSRNLHIPFKLSAFNQMNSRDLGELFHRAKEMRIGRFTILDCYTAESFSEEFAGYLKYVDSWVGGLRTTGVELSGADA